MCLCIMDDVVSVTVDSGPPPVESVKLAEIVEPVEPLSKNRRRKNAKQAAKARKEAAGESESSVEAVSETLSISAGPPVVAKLSQSVTTSKKSKSRNKHRKSDPAIRLMSPLKNKCQHEEKIAKAVENREQILLEKSEKVRLQTKKVDDVRHSNAAAIQHIRENLSDKLKRAEEKRLQQITSIKSRARDEATKVDEINFINNLKSQNRILDVKEKELKVVSRQQILEEERTKRNEENKARDAAVEDRRRQNEQFRVAKLSEMGERKRLKVQKVEQNLSDRLQQVREKARDRELKLGAIEAAQQANMDSLKEKIQKKLEISTRLHEERMELKRLRAQYLRSPRPGSADSAGNLHEMLTGDRCRSHTGDGSPRKDKDVKEQLAAQIELDHISDRYQRLGHKLRSKLLKGGQAVECRGSRLESGDVSHALEILDSLKFATTWEAWSPQLTASMEPCFERLARHVGSVVHSKDKMMAEELRNGVLKIVDISVTTIRSSINGDSTAAIPEKPVCAVYNLLSSLLNSETFLSLFRTDVFLGVVDQAVYFTDMLIFIRNGKSKVPETVFDSCFKALERILYYFDFLCRGCLRVENLERLTDFTRYFMTCGLPQMIGRYHTLQLQHEDGKLKYLRRSFQFTTWVSRLISARKIVAETDETNLETDLIIYRDVLKSAPVFGSVTLLYDLLRLGRSRPRCLESCVAEIPEESYRAAVDIIKMLNYIGNADLVPLQTAFRDLTLSIQFRHICSFLIEHCLTFHQQRAYLLHEVVLLIGQFAFLSADHQDIVHAGHPPTLLQQLARFPVEYLTVGTLQDVLVPTLLICCYQNRKNCQVMAEELDMNHLMFYIKDREMNGWPHKELDRHFQLAKKSTPDYQNVFREHCGEDYLRYAFQNRFPRSLWSSAAQFFFMSAPEEEQLVEKMGLTDHSNENLVEFYRDICSLLSDGGGL